MTRYTPPSWCLFIVLGCGSAPGQQRPEAASASASAPDRAESPSGKHERAHELVIAAVACWAGGLWSDAEGVAREKVVERIDTEYRATVAAVLREPGAAAQPMSRQ